MSAANAFISAKSIYCGDRVLAYPAALEKARWLHRGGRLTMAMQRTVQTVTKIAFAILPPVRPAADRRRYASLSDMGRCTGADSSRLERTDLKRSVELQGKNGVA